MAKFATHKNFGTQLYVWKHLYICIYRLVEIFNILENVLLDFAE